MAVYSELELDLGKVPPQDTTLERAVLGALMIDSASFYDVSSILNVECFYMDVHQKVFKAIFDLASSNGAIDILTVTDMLRRRNQLEEVGGPYFVTQLTSDVSSSAHIEYHSRVLRDLFTKREIIRIANENLRKAYDGESDPDDLIVGMEEDIYSLSSSTTVKDPKSITVGIREAVVNMEDYKRGKIVGVPSGFTGLDALTGGWQNSDLIILGGRPSQGKTQALLHFVLEAAMKGTPVLLFSLEMSLKALSQRYIFMQTGLSNKDVRDGLTDGQWYSVEAAIKQLESLPIFIDDTPGIGLMELRSKARRAKLKHNIGLIGIDYLGLMALLRKYKGASHSEEIGYLTHGLKNLSKELDVPTIALSQLNRALEIRGSKRPKLSDLRESGDIEQDADLVIFVHRPETYGDPDAEHHVGEFILAKHRNGPIGDVKFRHTENFSKLYNY